MDFIISIIVTKTKTKIKTMTMATLFIQFYAFKLTITFMFIFMFIFMFACNFLLVNHFFNDYFSEVQTYTIHSKTTKTTFVYDCHQNLNFSIFYFVLSATTIHSSFILNLTNII
jgi:hypothetical protein